MTKIKTAIIILGDAAIFYLALILTLIVRYGFDNFKEPLNAHLKPFSLILIVWLLIFYIVDSYKSRYLKINLETIKKFILAITVGIIASIILFYLFPLFFKLTPKTNLMIFASIFGVLDIIWRFALIKIYISGGLKNRLLIIGESPAINEIIDYLKQNPQLGYEIAGQTNEYLKIKNYQSDTIIIQSSLKKEPELVKIIYQLIPRKIAVIDLTAFYENIFQKIPLEEIEEGWFIEKISDRSHSYDAIKKIIDFCLSLFLIVIFLPLIMIIAFLIKLTSRGPAIYKQERTGVNDKPFVLFKFRTMKINESGPLWTTENDKRLTWIGRILRSTHLDELPQIYNILKGEMSFIGPRAERKELTDLYSQLPYYEIRHIIKPGLTGWAQVNYKPSASLEEAKEKLQYDIYYIKNRSLILDFLILLKTVKYLFVSPK